MNIIILHTPAAMAHRITNNAEAISVLKLVCRVADFGRRLDSLSCLDIYYYCTNRITLNFISLTEATPPQTKCKLIKLIMTF